MKDPMSFMSAEHRHKHRFAYSWVLVRVTVVLLSPEGTGLDICKTSNVSSPLSLECHLDEFGVLLTISILFHRFWEITHLNHGLHDTQERLV